jgi:hypothetical protein
MGFIVQLFVIPGVIVLVIVTVWLMFSWIAHRATARPEDVVQGLKGSGPARWQRASELADMLRGSRYPEFRRSSAAARQVADLLERELAAATSGGGMEPDAVNLRYFLARALGEFEVTDGLDVLLRAATTDRDPRETWMRRGAIQGLAVLGYNQLHAQPPQTEMLDKLVPVLLELAGDEEPLIRSETAFALGRVATPEALAQLVIMLDDPHTDTRYNAAVALAQAGRPQAVDTLVEMLDHEETISVEEELDSESRVIKRALIMKNAMQALVELARAEPELDYSAVRAELQEIVDLTPDALREAHIDWRIQSEAKRTLEFFEQRSAAEEEDRSAESQ